MSSPAIWEGIVIGVSAGFVSGLLLSAVIWLKGMWVRWVERREQIRYLAALIENYLKLIYDADDISGEGRTAGEVFPKVRFRSCIWMPYGGNWKLSLQADLAAYLSTKSKR